MLTDRNRRGYTGILRALRLREHPKKSLDGALTVGSCSSHENSFAAEEGWLLRSRPPCLAARTSEPLRARQKT